MTAFVLGTGMFKTATLTTSAPASLKTGLQRRGVVMSTASLSVPWHTYEYERLGMCRARASNKTILYYETRAPARTEAFIFIMSNTWRSRTLEVS